MTTITNDHRKTSIPANQHHKTIDSYTFLRFILPSIHFFIHKKKRFP